jgi:hypothetical protein
MSIMLDSEILKIVGGFAGLGGISLGVFYLLFREVIRKNIFPNLSKDQAYKLLALILILVWSIAVLGIIAWVYMGHDAPPSFKTNKAVLEKEVMEELNRTDLLAVQRLITGKCTKVQLVKEDQHKYIGMAGFEFGTERGLRVTIDEDIWYWELAPMGENEIWINLARQLLKANTAK